MLQLSDDDKAKELLKKYRIQIKAKFLNIWSRMFMVRNEQTARQSS